MRGVTTTERPGAEETPVGDILFDLDEQPPYAVILHNDDINGMDYVVKVIRKVFGYGLTRAIGHMIEAHRKGRSILWSGSLEIAELRAEQIVSCGPDPFMVKNGAGPLRVTVEPLPR